MLNVWTLKSGSSLGELQERVSLNQALPTYPLVGNLAGVTFAVISGKLPDGLRIIGSNIKGTPFEVNVRTEFRFVIRATLNDEISDRTFYMYVEGPDEPVWVTPGGDLSINPNGQAFVLDNTYIEFNLTAIDQDIKAGDTLDFFIQDGDGELPPGLTLSASGLISGKIDPILALDISAGNGYFDTNLFDSNPFDFGVTPRTGLDTFLYDSVVFDFIDLVKAPRKLNRRYEFYVSITDGISVIRRKFSIYVVGDDFLRADNTILQVGDGTFTADATYLRGAFWLSGSNLGIKRANNYVTIILEAFDANPALSPLIYELDDFNPDGTPSLLPEGLFLDPNNGEIFGFVPYQPAITRDYKFTVNAIKYDATGYTESEVAVVVGVNAPYGQNFLQINPLTDQDVTRILNEYLRIGSYQYKVLSYTSQTVVGGQYALLRLDIPLKIDVPARDGAGNPTVLTKRFIESTLIYNTNIAPKTFDIKILGEVDSVIKFITGRDLGKIRANFTSTLSVIAETSVPRAVLSYQLLTTNSDGTASKLPPGLTLNARGEIIGSVPQFSVDGAPGLTLFDNASRAWTVGTVFELGDVINYIGRRFICKQNHTSSNSNKPDIGINTWEEIFAATTFDGATQSYDRSYTFSVFASDQFNYSAIVGEFRLSIDESTDRLYSNIYARPYQKIDSRNYFSNFINDSSVFTPERIYRLNDPKFGVQTDLRLLVYAGIETRSIEEYVPFLNRNIKRKRFKMGEVGRAVAKEQGSNDILYEVIYIQVLDEYEVGKKSAALKIKLPTKNNSVTLVNQARNSAAQGDLSTAENQAKLLEDQPDRFRPVKDPYTADNTAVYASGQDQEYAYPSSLINIRTNLRNLSITAQDGNSSRAIAIENEFLPMWMKTSQDSQSPATGFVNAIPLCYCKPGQGQFVLDNVKNSGFDFGLIDYEIDRFLIDSTLGNSKEQFLKFTNYRYNV
jgi:hypothetical protein